jgi:penicillin-binding protein A
MTSSHVKAARRRKLRLRAIPLVVLAALAFVVGALIASSSPEVGAAERFTQAWAERNYDAMYAELTREAAGEYDREDFQRAYEGAERTATIERLTVGSARGPIETDDGEVVAVAVDVGTDSFGTISGELAVPVADGAVAWTPSVVFPGLRQGETLERVTKAPRRAPILARDRSPLAQGPVDARTITGSGGIIAGEVGAPSPERARQLERRGYPSETLAGTSGLELAFDEQLAGTPGGTLLAVGDGGERDLASAPPRPGEPLRTTLDPDLQQAATEALGDQFGGVAVLDATNGEVRALAGVAFSAPQPPGSTFKVITTVAALEEGVSDPESEYESVTEINAGGRTIRNAHEESCGGTLVVSFARSCNTVFAPLGVEVGAEKLLETAELFGFNEPPPLYNDEALAATEPLESTIPEIEGDVELAVTAIGQGRVLATPLLMASISQTIANGGVRMPNALVKDPELGPQGGEVEVTSPEVAGEVAEMMVEVVRSGTGTAAALPDLTVAGKTGTAELGPKEGQPSDPEADPELAVNAWFTGYAPARRPRLAVAVMIVNADGDGGVVAAPIAQQVLAAGL